MSLPPHDVPLAKNEILKAESDHLRGTLAEELRNESPKFEGGSPDLLKFHGMYQQDNRDERVKGADGKPQKAYSLMIRGRIPGGRLTAAQYAMWDDISTQYANGTLRITTRQSFQLHGVLKKNVKQTIKAIFDAFLTTTGACGDVVRNVTQAPNPWGDPKLDALDAVADCLSDHFKVASRAYHEVFLDEEPVAWPEGSKETEPLYGETYLPRKFKIGVTAVGNNSIDLYTNDMGFAATYTQTGAVEGYFVFVGGGLGMSHGNLKTYPRAASLLGWIPVDALLPVSEGVVTAQRDYGDRTNRKHARLKYTLDDRGVDWFRQEVEARSGVTFDQEKPLPPWNSPSNLGWFQTPSGTWSLGLHTLSGRIADRPGWPLKTLLRRLVDTYQLPVQLTADQDLILLNIQDSDKPAIEKAFVDAGINPASPSKLYDRALACVALPTCGLAITESERYFPDLLPVIQGVLDDLELSHRAPVVRMTGCPNGCARPYSAELGLVGRTVGAYALFVGGDPEGTRVGDLLHENVKIPDLQNTFRALFGYWKDHSDPQESFGAFTHRVPMETLRGILPAATP